MGFDVNDGSTEGMNVGLSVGIELGSIDGPIDWTTLGFRDGNTVKYILGTTDGSPDGFAPNAAVVGELDGAIPLGIVVSNNDGTLLAA